MSDRGARVAVVVPAYQAEHTIGRTLRSLLAQSDPRWRAVVVDDGSSDRTQDAVRAHGDPRITLHPSQHAGVSASRNIGFALSAESLVCFLDADDTLDPEYMELMIAAAENQPLGASCGYRYLNSDQDEVFRVPPAPKDTLALDTLLRLDPPAIMSLLHQRETLDRVARGQHLFDPGLSSLEDWDLLRRIATVRPGVWVPVRKPIASYHCTPNSLSSNIVRYYETGRRLLRTHGEASPNMDRMEREHALKCLAGCIVEQQLELAKTIHHDLGAIVQADTATLVGAIEWHAMRRWGLPESDLKARAHDVKSIVERVLCGSPVLPQVITRIDQWGSNPWKSALQRAEQAAGSGGRVVIFGLGRNGLQAVSQARRQGIECLVADDDPDRGCDFFPKITTTEITPLDAVIITPNEHTEIRGQLIAQGINRLIARDL